jgi:hypothetical protein
MSAMFPIQKLVEKTTLNCEPKIGENMDLSLLIFLLTTYRRRIGGGSFAALSGAANSDPSEEAANSYRNAWPHVAEPELLEPDYSELVAVARPKQTRQEHSEARYAKRASASV